MHKSIPKIVSSYWLIFLLLLLSATFAPFANAQQPAPKPSSPGNQSQATQSQAPEARDPRARVTETVIDSSISNDPAMDKLVAVYSPKVHELEVVIGNLKGELRKGGPGAGSMGNFVADGMRAQASLKLRKPVDLAIMNGGGLRRNTIGEGQLRVLDIFELLPFENALATLELTGEQVIKLLGVVVSSREAQSGARLTYVVKADKSYQLEAAKLLDENRREKGIEPKAIYTVVTIDYLINVGGDRYAVLREGKNLRPLGITVRAAIIDYVKSEHAAGRDIKPSVDGRFVLDRANSVLSGEPPPK
jgi:2',3'-cyclic-nucleotide 2'-phosphodiesterase (5'-nucleotidase family)